MTQLVLFPVVPAPSVLSCSFGVAWLDHFAPPIGTGLGCQACDTYDPPDPPRKKRGRDA